MFNLVKFTKDWADEFTAEGFTILTDEQVRQLESLCETGFDFYFGTNEGWDAGEVEFSDFDITPISEEEALFLERLFPDCRTYGFGQITYGSYIVDALVNLTE